MKAWKGEHANYAHVKYDGHYLQVTKDIRVTCTSRIGTTLDLSWVPSLKNIWLEDVPSLILGELWFPGEPASYVKTAIKNRDPLLRFSVFAVGDTFEQMVNICLKYGLDLAPYYMHDPRPWHGCLGGFSPSDLPPLQHEGYVMKDDVWLNWRKYKPFKTIDLVVTSITEGRGKYEGFVGSLVCGCEGRTLANVSGFDDDERMLLSEADIGRVIEVKYQYVGAGGRLRHPTFVRWRDDKLADDCLLSQDDDLCKSNCN